MEVKVYLWWNYKIFGRVFKIERGLVIVIVDVVRCYVVCIIL